VVPPPVSMSGVAISAGLSLMLSAGHCSVGHVEG
jgi:hypothetical protein